MRRQNEEGTCWRRPLMLRAGQCQTLPGNESSNSNTRKNQQFQGDNPLINLWVGALPGFGTPPDGQGCFSSQTSWRPPPEPACTCRVSLPAAPLPRQVPAGSGPPLLPFSSSPPFCPSLPTLYLPLQMCVPDGLLIESKLWVMSVTLETVATCPPARTAGL